jgi:hypothetical protein
MLTKPRKLESIYKTIADVDLEGIKEINFAKKHLMETLDCKRRLLFMINDN